GSAATATASCSTTSAWTPIPPAGRTSPTRTTPRTWATPAPTPATPCRPRARRWALRTEPPRFRRVESAPRERPRQRRARRPAVGAVAGGRGALHPDPIPALAGVRAGSALRRLPGAVAVVDRRPGGDLSHDLGLLSGAGRRPLRAGARAPGASRRRMVLGAPAPLRRERLQARPWSSAS